VETASVAPLQAPVQSDAPVQTARVAPPQAPVQATRVAPAQGNARAAAQPSTTVMSFASRSSGVGNASGNESGAISRLNYADRVLLWLKRHGTYPREGLRFKMEGVVLLRFAIRRDGKILSYDLIKESSWDTLNGAVRRMMDRSSPVPPIPEDIAKDEIVFTIPVRFTVHEGAGYKQPRTAYRRPRAARRSTSRRVWSR
jgi:protein TonB